MCSCVSLHILCYPCCPAVGLWRSSVDLHDTLCARMLEEVAEGEWKGEENGRVGKRKGRSRGRGQAGGERGRVCVNRTG